MNFLVVSVSDPPAGSKVSKHLLLSQQFESYEVGAEKKWPVNQVVDVPMNGDDISWPRVGAITVRHIGPVSHREGSSAWKASGHAIPEQHERRVLPAVEKPAVGETAEVPAAVSPKPADVVDIRGAIPTGREDEETFKATSATGVIHPPFNVQGTQSGRSPGAAVETPPVTEVATATVVKKRSDVLTYPSPLVGGAPLGNERTTAWEAGRLNAIETATLFQSLIDEGSVWNYPEKFRAEAARLIAAEICTQQKPAKAAA